MFLILEMILMVKAWRRGWRAWALVPLATTLFVGFLVGMAIAASGGTLDTPPPVLLLGDVACVGVLGVMSARPRSRAEAPGVAAVPGAIAAGSPPA